MCFDLSKKVITLPPLARPFSSIASANLQLAHLAGPQFQPLNWTVNIVSSSVRLSLPLPAPRLLLKTLNDAYLYLLQVRRYLAIWLEP